MNEYGQNTVFDTALYTEEDMAFLDETYREIRKTYVNYIESLSEQYGNSKFWWLIPFTSRNIEYDFVFNKIVRLIYIIRRIEQCKYDRVIVYEKEIYECLKIKYKSIELEYRGPKVRACTTKFVTIIKNAYCDMKYIYKNVWNRVIYGKLVTHKRRKVDDKFVFVIPLSDKDIMGKSINDRFFTNIQKYTTEDLIWLPMLSKSDNVNWRFFFRKLIAVDDHKMIFFEQYIHFTDFFILVPYYHYLRKLRKEKYIFEGVDTSPIFLKALMVDVKIASHIMFYYTAMVNFAKTNKPKSVIQWYEARTPDIAISFAYRNYSRGGKITGYIGFPISHTKIGIRPTALQNKNKVTPEVLAVVGYKYENMLREFFCEQKTITVPLYKNSNGYKERSNDNQRTLFICLSFWGDTSKRLLNIVNGISKEFLSKIKVVIKNHPNNRDFTLKDYGIFKTEMNYEFTQKTFEEIIPRIDAVFMGRSTTAMSFVCSGVKVLFCYEPGVITDTFIDPDIEDEVSALIYSSKQLEEELQKMSARNRIDLETSDYFISPNCELTEVLLSC